MGGETVFAGGLHTCINNQREIRSMVLTPNKGHNQFMPALAAISKSLQTYGHGPIQLVYTDNVRGDKAELERVLPSLRHDIVSVPEISSLEKLVIPSEWNITILSSAYQVNTRLNSLVDDLRDGDDLFIACDSEHPVDRANGIQGKVALLSFALNLDIFLIPVGFFSNRNSGIY